MFDARQDLSANSRTTVELWLSKKHTGYVDSSVQEVRKLSEKSVILSKETR